MIKNKRGSHVSFIISFVLFISFLIFFIGIIKPFEKNETGKSAILKHLENEIIKNVSDEILVISAAEKVGGSKSCSDINGLIGNNFFLKKDELIKIYSSDKFFTNNFQCGSTKDYEIGLIRSQNYIISSKVLDLNKTYNDDYETLKTNFGFPEINDFEFSFLDINEVPVIETKSKETPPTDVLAELVPINYLDENDVKIKNGYIKVILW